MYPESSSYLCGVHSPVGPGLTDHHDERSSRDDRHHREDRHQKNRRDNDGRREKTHFCYFHGKDKGHWTNECPFAIKQKKSLIGRIPSQRSQSIIPRSCCNSLRQWLPLGLRRQIGRCHIRFTTTTRCRTRTKCHLRNTQCQCYPLRSIVKHGLEAPHHSLMTQQVYPRLRSSSRGRY